MYVGARRSQGWGGALSQRQRKGKGGTLAGAGRTALDAAAVFAGELAADPEAEAGARPASGGEEGLEKAIPDLRGDAAAVVADFEASATFLGGERDPDDAA